MNAEDLAWQQDAACRDHNPDIFFPEKRGETEANKQRARQICATCPAHAVIGCARKADDIVTERGVCHGIWAAQHLDGFNPRRKAYKDALATIRIIAGRDHAEAS